MPKQRLHVDLFVTIKVNQKNCFSLALQSRCSRNNFNKFGGNRCLTSPVTITSKRSTTINKMIKTNTGKQHSSHLTFILFSIHKLLVNNFWIHKQSNFHAQKIEPVIGKRETIKHISSISAWAVHGRHPSTLLTACILQDRIEQHLRHFRVWGLVKN